MTRNVRRLDSSANDRYRVLQDPNRLASALSRAPFQFVTGLEHSAATEQNNVSARSSPVARFRFGQEGEHSVNGLCAVIHQCSLILLGRLHAHIG